jgi:hypothetical protein
MVDQVRGEEGYGGEVLTPVYSNYFNVQVTPDVTRLAFAALFRRAASDAVFHTVVAMTTENARILAELLLKTIAENERKTAGQQASPGHAS